MTLSCPLPKHCSEAFLVSFSGELAPYEIPTLERCLSQVNARETRAVILDLRGLTFIESAGWRCVEDFAAKSAPSCDVFILVSGCVKRLVGIIENLQGPSHASARVFAAIYET
jgi:anti-anti-sigma factor